LKVVKRLKLPKPSKVPKVPKVPKLITPNELSSGSSNFASNDGLKRRGRPIGAKNKPKIVGGSESDRSSSQQVSTPSSIKSIATIRKPIVANVVKVDRERVITTRKLIALSQPVLTRGRGRPLGAKNKPKP
jgi:hypothetical protein